MPTIRFITPEGEETTVDAPNGTTVMENAVKNDIPNIEAECGGACACATCHVYVDESWNAKLAEPAAMEEDMLDFAYDVQDNSRLSCQITMDASLDGIVVRVPERQA